MGVAGAGLFSLGLADLASPGLLGGKAATTSKTSITTTTSTFSTEQYSSLPDYADFLTWVHSVSGPYSGTSLDISLEAEFAPYATQLIDSDFATATGIKDQYDIKEYSLQLQDVSLMFSTQSSTYDAYSLDVENLGLFPTSSVSPAELAEQYPDLTYPELDLSDFDQFLWDRIALYPPDLSGSTASGGVTSSGEIQVLPFDTPTLVLFYRKDIYNQLGLTPPATWDDHFANSQAIEKSGLAPFGSVSMAGTDVSIVYEFLAHLSAFGGQLWDVDGNTVVPVMNNDQAISALEDYVRFEPLSDPGSFTYTWDDVFNSISHRSAGQGLLWNGYAEYMNDTLRSEVVGLVGYAPLPAGPSGSFSPVAASGVGLSKYSNKPEATWLWMQWATAKGTQEANILNEYHVYPTRSSVIETPEVQSALSTPSLAIASLTNQIWQAGNIATLMGFPDWLEASTILEIQLNKAWNGSISPSDALSGAQSQIESQVGTMTF